MGQDGKGTRIADDYASIAARLRELGGRSGQVVVRVECGACDDRGWLRWSPSVGQLGGLGKLGPGFRQAANLVTASTPYASSGVRPSRALCGRPAL